MNNQVRCGGCINPWNHQATPGKTLFAVTIVALAAIATAVGVLLILSALGYNIHVFNVSLKVLGDLTIYGGAAVTFVSLVIFAVGLSWLMTRACCRHNRPGNRGEIRRLNEDPQPRDRYIHQLPPFSRNPVKKWVVVETSLLDLPPAKILEFVKVRQNNPPLPSSIELHSTAVEKSVLNASILPKFLRNNPSIQTPASDPVDEESDSESDDLEIGTQTVEGATIQRLNTRLDQMKEAPSLGTTHTIPPVQIDNSALAKLNCARLERLNQRSQLQQRRQKTQNSAPATQNYSVKPNEKLLKLLEKQKAEQNTLSLSNSNAAQQPVQTLPQRNVRAIRRPVIAETGYEPLDLLKEERILRNQPQSFPLLETLNNVEPTKIKIVDNTNNRFVGTKEEQCIRQRKGFILNMKGKVNAFIGQLTHLDEVNTLIAFVMKQNEAFNDELFQNSVDKIEINEILDHDVIDMWRDLLVINQKSYLGEAELRFLDKCAEQPLPEAFRMLFIEISKLPTKDTYGANGVYTRLEKALGCEENTLFAYPMEECSKAFKLKLQEDIVSLFERTQDTPLTLVDLEKVKLYIDEEGKAFSEKYNFPIQIHEFFIPLYEFADKFQNEVFALFENSDTICLQQEALRNIQKYVEEEKPRILEKYCLKMDVEVLFVELQKFEKSWITYKKLSSLPLETDIDEKIDLWVELAHELPLANDTIWKRYPIIHNKLGDVLTRYFKSNPFSNYQFNFPLDQDDKLRRIRLEESSQFLCQKLGCKEEELPKIEVLMATEGDEEAALDMQKQFINQWNAENDRLIWEAIKRGEFN